MVRFAALFLIFLSLMVPASDLSAQSLFEVRAVMDSLRPDAYHVIAEGSQQGVYLGAKALFTLKDIDSVSLYTGPTGEGTPMNAVNITLRPSLNDSMRSLTAHSIGHRLAVLVDGKIVATPRILDPLKTARLSVSFATEAEARALMQKIQAAVKRK